MTIVIEPERLCALKDIKTRLAQKVQRLSKATLSSKGILRLEIQLDRLEPLGWLAAQKSDIRIFWSSRDEEWEMAGVGIAHDLRGSQRDSGSGILHQIQTILKGQPSAVRYFGGFRFQDSGSLNEWKEFGSSRFILPRFELSQRQDGTFFTCNIFINDSLSNIPRTILRELEDIHFPVPMPSNRIPLAKSRQDQPNRAQWIEIVQALLQTLKKPEGKKVVLARKTTFDFSEVIDPIAFLTKLRGITPECFHFLFQPSAFVALIGSSPERLYKRHGRWIESEAVAGTKPRGKTPSEDRKLQQELQNSRKEELEHLLVVDAINEALAKTCRTFEIKKIKSLMRFPWGQHLVTQFQGNLKDHMTDGDLLRLLHPTPAVAGTPVSWALKMIQECEGFDRGWYAGPVGYLGGDHSEFAVAIRCALIRGCQLSLFSGAGLVDGSSAQAEWDEVEGKISVFTQILNDGLASAAQSE